MCVAFWLDGALPVSALGCVSLCAGETAEVLPLEFIDPVSCGMSLEELLGGVTLGAGLVDGRVAGEVALGGVAAGPLLVD
ncbi:hypothetical protein GCM10011611_17260 [Aliidongia dinghuensis]|uniref:Uncharacterized protein n=1 Tax=Aliidongia dinghuensis TaxID=1867774 RepID=A0A8J3E471_9PROT|nr:hypothetical protein GCM10011611_17260 [Aliidongia dinghuensis]